MTWPPKCSSSPLPLTSVTPSTWSRTDPTAARDGPESPAATMPPTVEPGAKRGGSNGRHWPFSASSASSSASGVPARAVTTSSVGS